MARLVSAAGRVDEADVVVVGGGGSGLAAAVAAAQRRVETLLIEKESRLGGTTALSVGSFTAAGTRLQRRRGIRDSAAAFEADMALFAPSLADRDAPHLRALLAAEAGPTLEWLERLGVPFSGPFTEPPHRVARMHNVVPGSRMYIVRLAAAARRSGVRIHLDTRLTGLVRDQAGRVVGIRAANHGGDVEVRARRAVVLATGDFSGDAELRQHHLNPDAAAASPVNPNATGDGHRAAAEIGAALRNMDVIFGPQLRFSPAPRRGLVDRLPTWGWLGRLEAAVVNRAPAALLRPLVKSMLVTHMSPTAALFTEGAILVNTAGERFCDEARATAALARQPKGIGYIVLDGRIAARFDRPPFSISTAPGIAYAYWSDYVRARPDLVRSSPTVAGLASAIGVDPDHLQMAIETAPAGLQPPYHALGPVRSMLTVTEGGIAVDETLRVLDAEGRPIQRLYAAGGAGQGGMQLLGHGHHIAWAMTSGRLAGEFAARAPAHEAAT